MCIRDRNQWDVPPHGICFGTGPAAAGPEHWCHFQEPNPNKLTTLSVSLDFRSGKKLVYASGQLLAETTCNMSLKGTGAQGSYFAIGQFAGLDVPGGCLARFADIKIYAHPLSKEEHERMCHPPVPVVLHISAAEWLAGCGLSFANLAGAKIHSLEMGFEEELPPGLWATLADCTGVLLRSQLQIILPDGRVVEWLPPGTSISSLIHGVDNA